MNSTVVRNLRRPAALLFGLTLTAAACGTASETSAEGDDGGAIGAAALAQSEDESMEDESMEDESMEDESMEDDAMADESGTVLVTIENIGEFPVFDSGAFAVPSDGDEPGPALPGAAYEFSVRARPGDRLSFATMLVQTNDWFVAPAPDGIALFDEAGEPVSGDLTDSLYVFDAGTEIDQPFGEGVDQAPRQAGPDTGDADPDGTVRIIEDRSARDYVSVVITPAGDGRFDVVVKNDSTMAIVPTPIAPGAYAVHTQDTALFTVGQPDTGDGLEALAEDGDPAALADHLAAQTGVTTPIAPGAWAVHGGERAFYTLGGPDAGLGLEALAEDGDPEALGESLASDDSVSASGVFSTPDGEPDAGPLLPGGSYSFEVPFAGGEYLSFATMLVQSNDWVFATPAEGLALHDLTGDITDQLLTIDVGTEVDQTPGAGPDQAPRQAGPDTGADDPDPTVRVVEGFDPTAYLRVTVEPVG